VVPLLQRANRPVVAIVAVTAIAGFLRFFHLAHPPEFVFDEVYYPKAGCILIGWSNDVCHIDSNDERYWRDQKWDVGSWVHPPLGKWEIGLGIKAFGMNPLGWRWTSALAGTLVVMFVAIIAQLLFGSALWTFVAGVLIATENLNVVMSRTAILDVHLELWVVAGFLFLVLDRRWIDRREPVPVDADPVTTDNAGSPSLDDDPPIVLDDPLAQTVSDQNVRVASPSAPTYSPLWRPWRFAAGAAFGAAIAVKWSGVAALAAAVLLSLAWETTRRRRPGRSLRAAFGRALARESLGIVLAFLIVPFAVYFITWLPWFNHWGYSLLHDPVTSFKQWGHEQAAIWDYHAHDSKEFAANSEGVMTPTHPYYAHTWTWILMLRPISFYVQDLGPDIQQILAIGNPAVFWASFITMPYLVFAWRRLRDWRAGFILIGFAMQYVPWFFVSRPQFFFYVLPMTPFMVLGVVYLARQLSEATIVLRDPVTGEVDVNPDTGEPAVSVHHPYLPFVTIYLVIAVGLLVLFWPVLTAGQISDEHWKSIVWFRGWV